jgi:hypothetical protein
MVLAKVFDKFAKSSPVAVMARATMERALDAPALDALFREHAESQYEKELLFSSLVDLMALVVCGVHPSVRRAYESMREELPVTLSALYAKLNHVEVGTSQALVAASAGRLRPVIDALGGASDPWLPGYRVKALDGNHIAATERRLEVLRDCAAGPLPGQSLVVLEPETGLAIQMVGCEDGHAQERSLLGPVLDAVDPNDVYIADRNFCTRSFLLGVAERRGFFVIRQHAQMPVVSTGTLRRRGRVEGGEVFEQPATLRLGDHELVVRRVVVRLDTPTRDGDTELAILTQLPAGDADATTVANLYRRRWSIESLFARVERNLQSELSTLGYPGAAVFTFAVALVASNVFAIVHAAMTKAHESHSEADATPATFSDFAIVEEVRSVHRGMSLVLDGPHWTPFRDLSPSRFATTLLGWARHIKWTQFRKARRGPKGPRPKRSRFLDTPHVSTARLLGRA